MVVSEKKREYAAKVVSYINTYRSAFIVGCDNVGSKQMQQIRVALRGTGVVVMGKNTTIRKVIKDFIKKGNEGHSIETLLEFVVGNVGIIFTNADLSKVRDIVKSNKVPAPARVGALAPVDVFVEPGPTGCDPGQTAWFQALNIPTKINKGQIEMISRVQLLKVGDKVGESQAALLQKLNIKPFSYGMNIEKVYDNGSIYDVAVLDVKPEDLMTKFMSGVSTIAAASLALGIPTKASVVHSINDAYKALLAIGLGTDYKFAAVAAFENFLSNASNFVAAPTGGASSSGGAAPKKEEKKEEEEEEEVGGAGGLFGGGDDDW